MAKISSQEEDRSPEPAVPPSSIALWLMKWSWRALIATLLFMVASLGLSRLLFSSLPALQPELSRLLSDRLHADLHIDSMLAQWNSGEPLLVLQNLSLKGKDASVAGFSIDQLHVALDLRSSLLNWTPVFNSLVINGISVQLVQGDGASWTLAGIDQIAGSSLPDQKHGKGKLFNWLALQQMVDIRDIRLHLRKTDGTGQTINGHHLKVATEGNLKALSARLEMGSGFASLEGLGDISQGSFSGWQGTVHTDKLDVKQLCLLWGGCHDSIMAAQVQFDSQWRYDGSQWQLAGQLALPVVTYLNSGGGENNLFAQTRLFAQGSLDDNPDWQLWLNDLTVVSHLPDGTATRWENSWYFAGGYHHENTITVASKMLTLDAMKQWLLDSGLLPAGAEQLVRILNPKGTLNDLALRLYPSRKPVDFDLSARLDNVSVDAWHGAPSGGNVSGPLRMSLLQGYLDLDTENFRLGFPRLFRDIWTFTTAKARLYWDVVDDYYILRSDDIALTGQKEVYKGKLRLDVPLHKGPGNSLDMALTVGLSHGSASLTSQFLPTLLPMSQSLTHWLDTAIRHGDLSGGFVYNGALTKVADPVRQEKNSRWGLFFDVRNGELDYSPDWPGITDLNARVLVNDDRVEVLGKSARSVGADLTSFVARTPLHGGLLLQVDSQFNAGGDALKYFLTQTPINDRLDGAAQSWQLTGTPGSLAGSLSLSLPLDNMEHTKVDIRGNVQSFGFAIPDQGVDVSKIIGDLSFSTERGLVARQLSGSLFGNPATFDIGTTVVNNKPVSTDIAWLGRISMTRLQRWLKQDWLGLLRGETDYRARLSVGLTDHTTVLRVDSRMLGIANDLPAPLNKSAIRPQQLDLTLRHGKKDDLLDIKLDGLGQAMLGLTAEFGLSSARIILGASTDDQSLPDKGSIVVNGALAQLNLGSWQDFFQKGASTPSSEQLALINRLEVDKVRIGSLRWGEYRWPDVSVSLSPALRLGKGGLHQKGTALQVSSETLKGVLWRPVQQNAPWLLAVDHAYLPAGKEEKTASTPNAALAGVNPHSLPDIDVQVKKFRLGNRPPISVAFDARRVPDGLRIDNVAGDVGGMSLDGLADWVQVDGEQHSWSQSLVRGGNIHEVLQFFGLGKGVKAQESEIASSLNWIGPPYAANATNLKGWVNVLLKKGSLKLAGDGSSDALKLLGILNIESLARRLTLDFSDLYSTGISFDQVKAKLIFNRGVITFDEPMVLEGSSSDLKLDGTIDMNREQLDLSLVVTLPLTSNLPILSVLLGTAPQVAGIIYIADKLLGKQVDQLASIRYNIRGSFSDPKMTFDQWFASQPRKDQRQKAEN